MILTSNNVSFFITFVILASSLSVLSLQVTHILGLGLAFL